MARNLIQDNNWKVKVLTRNPDSQKSKSLKKLGIELLKGDLNDQSSYKDYLKDVYGIFSVQNFTDGIDKEINQGKQLADLAIAFRSAYIISIKNRF